MTIQDFNEALDKQESTSLRAFGELKKERVRELLDDELAPADSWYQWS